MAHVTEMKSMLVKGKVSSVKGDTTRILASCPSFLARFIDFPLRNFRTYSWVCYSRR